MKSNLISVIVPAYNAEPYLQRCIESICAQDYTNLEILLVCTTSEDNTESLCAELAKQDSRIRLFPCPKKGVSNARNIALESAEGEYIAFVDADDYVKPNYISRLHQGIQGHDISLCGFDRVKDLSEESLVQIPSKLYDTVSYRHAAAMTETARPELLGTDTFYSRDRLIADVLCNNTVGGYLWNKLFRSSLIRQAHLRFQPELSIGEDMAFITEYAKSVRSGYYCNEVCYHYCTHAESALQKMYTTGAFEESKLSNIAAARFIFQSLQKDSPAFSPIVREAASYRVVRTGLWTVFNLLKCRHFDREILKSIQKEMQGNVLAFCRNPQSKMPEKVASVIVRVWPIGFWQVACIVLRIVPEEAMMRYVN